MVDMNIFLAVDGNGLKLATKAKFWHAATPMMWAVPTVEIWAVMRENGWAYKETQAASVARRQVIGNIEHNAKKKRDHEAAIKNIDMNVFLAVDDNGLKLATKAAFWKSATAMMMAVPTVEIRAVMRAHGWVRKEIDAARVARDRSTPEGHKAANAVTRKRRSTPEGRARDNASTRKSARKRLGTPEGREAHNASARKRGRKPEAKKATNKRRRERYVADPKFRMKIKLRNTFGRIIKKIKKRNLSIDLEQTKRNMKPNGEYDIDAYENALEKTLPHGVTMDDWRSGNSDLHVEHIVSLDFAIEHDDKFPGLLSYAISPANVMFLDKETNISKSDKIILEIIPSHVPGYPFNGLDGVYQTFEEAMVRRETFKCLF